MEFETDELALQRCKSKIEEELGWGDSERWHTKDYETLSVRIHERTGVTLSVATLKRLWGKIRYDSKPTPTTLNTLAQYLGYESWRSFAVDSNKPETKAVRQKRKTSWIVPVIVILIIAVAGWWLFHNEKTFDPALFTFSSKKVVDLGVPNTVVFDYDASAASAEDSVFVQQSWDKQLSRLVKRDQHQHTSIYYYPGFFEAKLVVNNQVIKEHNLLIKTAGWLPIVEQPGTPVYYKSDDAIHDGVMSLPLKSFDNPWTDYYNVTDFGDLTTDDVIFETSLKSESTTNNNPCQYVEIRLQFEGPAVLIPLSAKSCVASLSIADTNGTLRDLSGFGCDFSNWVNVKCVIKNRVAEIFVNDVSAIQLKVTGGRAKMVEIGYRFQGTGSVDFVRLTDNEGKVFYEDQF